MVTRVLIVEDQKIMQKHFEEIIAGEREFCHIKTIRDASQAAACCAGNQVDLVLMDVQTLHNNSGLTAAKTIKEKYPWIKVVIITSLIDPEILVKSRASKADGLWYKDYSEEEILSVLKRVLLGEKIFPDSAPSVEINSIDSSKLSPRQLEMLRLYIKGFSYGEIGQKMNCSTAGVRWNFQDMIAKAGFSCKEELLAAALESKLIVTTLKE